MTSYSEQFSCHIRNVTNDVCICPKGYGDFLCATADYRKCWVQIIDPDLAKGCSDREDTPYYLYSVPGFSPCYFFDFNSQTDMTWLLTC